MTSPVRDPRDEVSFDALTRLTSDLTSAQRQLAKKNVELEGLVKLKNEFLGMAAHDLRNPIGGVERLAEMLLEETQGVLGTEHLELLELIRSAAADMRSLVESFLDASRIDAGKLTLEVVAADLVSLLQRRVALIRFAAEKKSIALELRTSEPRLVLAMDPPKLAQVVDNLLGNAIKFSPAGSRVTIALAVDGDHAVVSVSDEGPGLKKEDIALLYRPFSTASARGTRGEPSIGLGLAIAKKIVDVHGGRISVRSEPGQGATFEVALPLDTSASAT
jgi:signal transduction histidine kinase